MCNAKTIRGGGDPCYSHGFQCRGREWARLRGPRSPMRMTASWSDLGSTEYKVVVRSHAGRSPLGLFCTNLIEIGLPNEPNRNHAMSSRPAARLAPCSMLSRTLRAGIAGAASGILDSLCARRPADGQVGTKGWPPAVEQRDGTKARKKKCMILDFCA